MLLQPLSVTEKTFILFIIFQWNSPKSPSLDIYLWILIFHSTLDHISNVLRLVATRAARGRNTRMKWNVVSWKIVCTVDGEAARTTVRGGRALTTLYHDCVRIEKRLMSWHFFSTLTLLPFDCFFLRRFADIRFFASFAPLFTCRWFFIEAKPTARRTELVFQPFQLQIESTATQQCWESG